MMMARVHPKEDTIQLVETAERTAKPAVVREEKIAIAAAVSKFLEGDWKRARIPSMFKKKECKRFVFNSQGTKDPAKKLCGCGRLEKDHDQATISSGDYSGKGIWNSAEDTEEQPTNAYGQMEFVGFSQREANFIRVSNNTPIDSLLELMLCEWKLEPPNLLISVTGGAKNFTMKPRLKDVFRRGLIKAAQSTGAWIMTGGTNAGVMKQVGEAIRDYSMGSGKAKQVVCMGITPWGSTCNRSALIDPKGKWPAAYEVIEPQRYGEIAVEANHSHFIFVDDGTASKFGGEIKFRGRLEALLSEWKKSKAEQLKKELGRVIVPVKIPLVVVVLEGGPGTIGTVYEAVSNGTPAVFVEGSGRAADIFAYAYFKCKEVTEDAQDAKGGTIKVKKVEKEAGLQEKIYKMVEENWGDKQVSKLTDQVMKCMDRKELLNVFRLDSSDSAKDIDVAILQALLKANKEAHIEQLQLALAWNRIDIARSEIFTEDKKWKVGELDQVMHQALIDDRADFVQAFMENGVSLKTFVTRKRVLRLYSEIPQNSILNTLLEKRIEVDKQLRLCDIGNLIQDMIGEFYEPLYLQAQYNEEKLSKTPGTKGEKYFPTPSCELFIWAVLLNRCEMAELFWEYWEEGKESIAAALTASKLLKYLAEKATDYDQQSRINEHAKVYEDRAIGVLNECFSTDEKRAQFLLVRVNKNFGHTTCLQLAVDANNLDFLAHSCCQALLSDIWYGNITLDTSKWRLFLSTVFPPLLLALIVFREDVETTNETRTGGPSRNGTALTHRNAANAGEQGNSKEGGNEVVTKASFEPKRKKLSFTDPFNEFFDAPIITFSYNCFSYIAFLLLYSFIMIEAMNDDYFTVAEVILCIWIFSFVVEEARQVVADDAKRITVKLYKYWSDYWNRVDLVTLSIFIVGIILRCIPFALTASPYNRDRCFLAARILLSFDLMLFYFRIFHMFSVLRTLGPKIVMIGGMLKDMLFFSIILAVIMLAYGVATQTILYQHVTINGDLIVNIFRKVYWQFFGEARFDDLADGYCLPSSNGTICAIPEGQKVSQFLIAGYTFFTNVLLMNLLIALLNLTVNSVQEKTDKVWMYQRYFLINEYYFRPGLAPPFILFLHVYLIVRYLIKVCCHPKTEEESNVFRIISTEDVAREWIKLEAECANEYVEKTQRGVALSEEESRAMVMERIDGIDKNLEEFHDSHTAMMERQSKKTRSLDSQMTDFEEKLIHMASALRFIVECTRDPKKASTLPAPEMPDYKAMIEEEKRKQAEIARQVKQIRDKLNNIHTKARTSPYPDPSVQVNRFPVNDDQVDWKVPFPDYRPVNFTAKIVLTKPLWADDDLLPFPVDKRPKLPFNRFDDVEYLDRQSHMGTFEVVDGIPVNPRGRTGMSGRGLLGRWGPNHAGDPIVTRWRLDNNKKRIVRNGKNVLEFIAIKRNDNKQFAIPGGMVDPGQKACDSLKTDFTEEALGSLVTAGNKEEINRRLDELWTHGHDIYKGYSDDPRNTDNAWIETHVINYHDEDGSILHPFQIRAGEQAEVALWQEINSNTTYHASHGTFLRMAAERLDAAFD